ncbi:MAG: hypothetical protein ED554_11800 [Synechococcus sp. YX04-3]|nr:MAG: hypothetical protein ED554_11800 [Synechococcus sp. YX04-3]
MFSQLLVPIAQRLLGEEAIKIMHQHLSHYHMLPRKILKCSTQIIAEKIHGNGNVISVILS